MQLYCTLASTYLPAGHELFQSIEQRPSEPGLVLLLLFYRVRVEDGLGEGAGRVVRGWWSLTTTHAHTHTRTHATTTHARTSAHTCLSSSSYLVGLGGLHCALRHDKYESRSKSVPVLI